MSRGLSLVLSFVLMVMLPGCENNHSEGLIKPMISAGADPASTTLVIKRLSDDRVWIVNSARAKNQYIPASTTKIPHTLIALEMGLASPETIFKWDGQARAFSSWNQDQSFTQAYQRSAVWVYQDIIREIGRQTMASWLEKFDYGNHDISTGELTQYWLTGPLKISATEQVEFLTKVVNRELPLSPKTYETARVMFENESSGSHTLYAKTGWMYDENAMDIGWFVGWVEVKSSSDIYVFALNMDMPNAGDQRKRKPIVMAALKAIGAWPE